MRRILNKKNHARTTTALRDVLWGDLGVCMLATIVVFSIGDLDVPPARRENLSPEWRLAPPDWRYHVQEFIRLWARRSPLSLSSDQTGLLR